MSVCPCGSKEDYSICCEPIHTGTGDAETAEQLMRSRYTAFVKGDVGYLKRSTWPAYQKDFNEAAFRDQIERSKWIGLAISERQDGLAEHTKGTVTFTANAIMDGQMMSHHEKSLFKKKAGRWYFVRSL